MNDLSPVPIEELRTAHDATEERATARPLPRPPGKPRGRGGLLLGLGVVLVLGAGLMLGGWRHYSQARAALETTEQSRDRVTNVRVAAVLASAPDVVVTLPATTLPFTSANIYARASGYISERNVDIGDRVRKGQLLAQINAPELDRQIAQNEATLAQNQASLQQAEANRDLARVTWQRNSTLVKQGWVTQQQGDTDRLTLQAQQAAVEAAKQFVAAQQGLLGVLHQQKAYQSVIAPFDGIVTQRNINIGDLVQADAASGTFMFTVVQSDVIRTQVHVPQNDAVGVKPGIEAVVRVPEIPGRTFPGKVARIADALQPGTRTLLTEIDIPNPDGALRPGIYCLVELHIPRDTPAVLVPADALIFNRDGLQVAVIEDGTARIRKIAVARDLGTQLEERAGGELGEQVILNPSVNLANGSRVQARSQARVAGN